MKWFRALRLDGASNRYVPYAAKQHWCLLVQLEILLKRVTQRQVALPGTMMGQAKHELTS